MEATLTFLGTGTSMGVPTLGCDCAVCTSPDPHNRRTRPSIRLAYNQRTVLIDTGPDFHAQALREDIRRIDAVLLLGDGEPDATAAAIHEEDPGAPPLFVPASVPAPPRVRPVDAVSPAGLLHAIARALSADD